MCDERTATDTTEYLRAKKLTRRQFGAVSAGAGLAALWPRAANAQDVTASEIDVTTPAGTAVTSTHIPAGHGGLRHFRALIGVRAARIPAS